MLTRSLSELKMRDRARLIGCAPHFVHAAFPKLLDFRPGTQGVTTEGANAGTTSTTDAI